MQRCPKCNRTYPDDAPAFCPQDGAHLIRENAAPPPPQQWPNQYQPNPYQPQANQAGYQPPPPDQQNPYAPQTPPASRRSKVYKIAWVVISVLSVIVVLLSIIGSLVRYGTKLEYGSLDLYYTKNVTEADAKKLGDYLKRQTELSTGNKKTVQLDKSGDTYQYRVVVKEGIDKDEQYIALYRDFANELSKNVFNGAKVEVDLCDKHLKTLKAVPMSG